MNLDDDTLDRFRFSLMRLQLYADIHRNEDLERAMHIKYVAQVLEKVIFGSLVMEPAEACCRLILHPQCFYSADVHW